MKKFNETILFSVLTWSCPRCHKGSLFLNKNPYKISDWDKMHPHCPHCHLKYELEPGFFQGAMYVSYALGVALSVGVFLIFWLSSAFSPLGYFIANTISLLVFAPLLFRWARTLYLNFFIHFKKAD